MVSVMEENSFIKCIKLEKSWKDSEKNIIWLICSFIFSFQFFTANIVLAEETYTPPRGSLERNTILDTLREGLKHFPDKEPSKIFQYVREGIRIPLDLRPVFVLNYLKVKDDWAWIEMDCKNYVCSIDALLLKEDGKWQIKVMVNPHYFVCLDQEECSDVKAYIYKKVIEKYPRTPVNIFPVIHPERKQIVNVKVLRPFPVNVDEDLSYLIYVVRYFGIKDGWVWIETDPRSTDGRSQFEPIEALLHKEKGKWVVKEVRPCCGECADDPECNDIKRYYKKLMRKYPAVPREIFPK